MDEEKIFLSLSPLDGRYADETSELRPYFSEFAFILYRIRVEIAYILALSQSHIIRPLTTKEKVFLYSLEKDFSLPDAVRVKTLEKETRHDVKAIEYFLKEKFMGTSCADLLQFVHFGLTSEDINNIAYSLMVTDAHTHCIMPHLSNLIDYIEKASHEYKDSMMVARTHGQVAVPTTFGKECAVYLHRLKKMQVSLRKFRMDAKVNGAVGNYNALVFAFPKTDWILFSKKFVATFGLVPNLVTTQILPADRLISYVLLLHQINTIFVGLCQDMWIYISRGLVHQKKENQEVGSSTMPQKINPIHFENAEGNCLLANSYFELFARKLPVSRMQRDLSDSTVKRNIGASLGYTLLAWKSLLRGLTKVSFDTDVALSEMDGHWEMLAEAMQIYFKLKGDEKGYEKVKGLLQGKQIDKKMYQDLVRTIPVLAKLTPIAYSGLAKKLSVLP